MVVSSRWRGTTAEERVAQRRERILDAGRRLMADGGTAAVTVRAVCRGSGVSPRLFYESFPDRESVVLALWDEQYADLSALVERGIDDARPDFADRMRAALRVTVRWFEDEPWRAVVMLRETLADESLRAHARERLPELVLVSAARSAADEGLLAAIPPASLRVAIVALSGAILNLFLEWTSGSLDVTADQMVDQVVVLTMAALRGNVVGD